MLESLKSVREKSSNSVDLSRNLCIKSLKRFDVKSLVNEVRNASTFYIVQRKDLQKKSFDQGSIVIEQGSIMDELESLSSSGAQFS